jgi:hypothetical protein
MPMSSIPESSEWPRSLRGHSLLQMARVLSRVSVSGDDVFLPRLKRSKRSRNTCRIDR